MNIGMTKVNNKIAMKLNENKHKRKNIFQNINKLP